MKKAEEAGQSFAAGVSAGYADAGSRQGSAEKAVEGDSMEEEEVRGEEEKSAGEEGWGEGGEGDKEGEESEEEVEGGEGEEMVFEGGVGADCRTHTDDDEYEQEALPPRRRRPLRLGSRQHWLLVKLDDTGLSVSYLHSFTHTLSSS